MTFDKRPIEDLVRIAAAGGGFELDASALETDSLVKIAAAGAHRGGQITLIGSSSRPTDDLVKIAAAGRGTVVFAD